MRPSSWISGIQEILLFKREWSVHITSISWMRATFEIILFASWCRSTRLSPRLPSLPGRRVRFKRLAHQSSPRGNVDTRDHSWLNLNRHDTSIEKSTAPPLNDTISGISLLHRDHQTSSVRTSCYLRPAMSDRIGQVPV